MSAYKVCPQCNGPVVNTFSFGGPWMSACCERCGWDSQHRSRIYSPEEAREELELAARALLRYVHTSGAMFVRHGVCRTAAQELREQADAIEDRDAAVRRLEWAVARLDVFSAEPNH